MRVLAIDPGSTESAWCLINSSTLKPFAFAKEDNFSVLGDLIHWAYDVCVIEKVASYGMPVGEEVFDTWFWAGRFAQVSRTDVDYIYRREEKLHICGDSRAKDANIRRALIDRFAVHDKKNGKGTRLEPDFFHGFKADIWAAYAVGLTWIETKGAELEKQKAEYEHPKITRCGDCIHADDVTGCPLTIIDRRQGIVSDRPADWFCADGTPEDGPQNRLMHKRCACIECAKNNDGYCEDPFTSIDEHGRCNLCTELQESERAVGLTWIETKMS